LIKNVPPSFENVNACDEEEKKSKNNIKISRFILNPLAVLPTKILFELSLGIPIL